MASAAEAVPKSFVTHRPVAVFVVTVATVVFGGFSLRNLPVALMPELSYPTLTVRTEYPGAAPEEVENDVSRPVEEALGVIGGLRRLSSISRAGVSDVVLEFAWDTEMSEAAQETLERLDLVFLPTGTERPLILRYDPSLDPVMELALSGEGQRFNGEEGLRRLRRLADREVKRALEPIKGVAAVRVRGGLEEEIHVAINEEKLRRSGLPVEAVIRRLAEENVNVAGGTIKEGRTEYMVRTVNEFVNLDEIRRTVVATLGGREVRIEDVAEVGWSHADQQILTRTDGGVSVALEVFKEADANIVDLALRVKARLEGEGGLAAELAKSEGAALKVVADRSLFIASSISEVKSSAVFGGLLAVLVLFVFLRSFWTTLIVALSIPVSLLITFAPLDLLGLTLNIMSLGGLALGVGMLVDNSIVVLESIFRCREEGDDFVTAAVRGTAEVKAAVISSTLTTVAVFFPMVFVEGIAGEAFADLGMAVVASLLASLVVAIYLVPMLASRRARPTSRGSAAGAPPPRFTTFASTGADARHLLGWFKKPTDGGLVSTLGKFLARMVLLVAAPLYLLLRLVAGLLLELAALAALVLLAGLTWVAVRIGRVLKGLESFVRGERAGAGTARPSGLLDRLRRAYEAVVRGAVRRPAPVAALMLGLLAVTALLGRGLGSELLPEVHQGEFTVEVALPVGTPLAESDATLAPIERAILAERAHIRSLILTVGFDPETSQRSDEGEHTARLRVLLDSSEPRVEEEVVGRIRRRLAEVPDLQARVVRPVLFSFKTPIEVEVYGDDLDRLKRQTDAVREAMAALPELADVEATLKRGAPEVQIVYDRDLLARYGLAIRQVANLVRDQVKGSEATRFNLKDRRIPVVVRLGEEDRETVAEVANLVVNPGAERPVPLSAVAEVSLAEGPSEVRRIDARRVAVVGANIAQGSLAGAVSAIERAVSAQVEWPADMSFFVTGQNEEWQRSRSSLFLALGLSLFLVYVIMAAQFESLLQPLVIMFSIPLAFFGSAVALALLDIPVSIVVFLGAILLGGVVVNNAIVLIDYVNLLRQRGMEREEAVVTAGTVRLRPILMTTGTTVLGLIPMALGLGDGAEIRMPLAVTVISGLAVSTLLTLVVIPAIYVLADEAKERLLGRGRRAEQPAASSSGGLALPVEASPEVRG